MEHAYQIAQGIVRHRGRAILDDASQGLLDMRRTHFAQRNLADHGIDVEAQYAFNDRGIGVSPQDVALIPGLAQRRHGMPLLRFQAGDVNRPEISGDSGL